MQRTWSPIFRFRVCMHVSQGAPKGDSHRFQCYNRFKVCTRILSNIKQIPVNTSTTGLWRFARISRMSQQGKLPVKGHTAQLQLHKEKKRARWFYLLLLSLLVVTKVKKKNPTPSYTHTHTHTQKYIYRYIKFSLVKS